MTACELKPKINVNLPQCIVISAAQNGEFEQFGFALTVTVPYALTQNQIAQIRQFVTNTLKPQKNNDDRNQAR